jgi:uncharacterized protein YdhG (YjbR/CyaY superfamily)
MPKQKEVEDWLERYENPMKPVVLKLREIVLSSDRRMDECIKWQAPTFTYKGNMASFFPKSKKHASLMFHQGAKIPGTHDLLEGEGETSRVMKIGSIEEVEKNREAIEKLVKAWCDWKDQK